MRKTFLLIFTVAVFVSCSKDDSDFTQIDENCKVTEWRRLIDEGNGFFASGLNKFYYDDQNRVSKVETYYENKLAVTTNYSYTSNKITANSSRRNIVYTLNANNLIESYITDNYDTTNIAYNSSNQISTISQNRAIYTFKYANGNLIEGKQTYKDPQSIRSWAYTYDNSKNFSPLGTFGVYPFSLEFGWSEFESSHILYDQGYFGVKIKNAISTVDDEKYNYVFLDGKIFSYENEEEKFEFKYTCK